MANVTNLIDKGIAAAKSNHKEEAEEWLSEAVSLDPANEYAWLWLSAVVEGPERQQECLRRVLEINPANTFARTGLSFISHLRPGYEYMAARAPWMEGVEEGRAALAELPARRCPRCGTVNPGWAYLCNRCAGPLEPVDVAQIAKQEIRQGWSTPSLVRSWAGAAVLDADLAFTTEVSLASPLRAILAVALGSLALNLLRLAGSAALATLSPSRYSYRMLERLAMASFGDQVGLLVGALVAWLLLAAATRSIARSLGGLGSARVHYYLIAVAISAWMPIAGVTGLLWWLVALLVPQIPPSLLAALACGTLFFYAVTLLTQALHITHDQQTLREAASVGALLIVVTVVYAGLTAISPPTLQTSLLQPMQLLLLPIHP